MRSTEENAKVISSCLAYAIGGPVHDDSCKLRRSRHKNKMASPTLVFWGVLVGIDREFIEEIENELFTAGLLFSR